MSTMLWNTTVSNYVSAWTVFDMTAAIVLEATRGVRDHQFSFWDAQIWASARMNQIPLVLSEDFQDGANIEGVRFRNPFAPEFDIQKVVG
ncbi:MAG: PIN domain-containing protein [Chloroflexi bacterium]|nr:PIN domain-containing protein [Chloroflexota bacterium]